MPQKCDGTSYETKAWRRVTTLRLRSIKINDFLIILLPNFCNRIVSCQGIKHFSKSTQFDLQVFIMGGYSIHFQHKLSLRTEKWLKFSEKASAAFLHLKSHKMNHAFFGPLDHISLAFTNVVDYYEFHLSHRENGCNNVKAITTIYATNR